MDIPKNSKDHRVYWEMIGAEYGITHFTSVAPQVTKDSTIRKQWFNDGLHMLKFASNSRPSGQNLHKSFVDFANGSTMENGNVWWVHNINDYPWYGNSISYALYIFRNYDDCFLTSLALSEFCPEYIHKSQQEST